MGLGSEQWWTQLRKFRLSKFLFLRLSSPTAIALHLGRHKTDQNKLFHLTFVMSGENVATLLPPHMYRQQVDDKRLDIWVIYFYMTPISKKNKNKKNNNTRIKQIRFKQLKIDQGRTPSSYHLNPQHRTV